MIRNDLECNSKLFNNVNKPCLNRCYYIFNTERLVITNILTNVNYNITTPKMYKFLDF